MGRKRKNQQFFEDAHKRIKVTETEELKPIRMSDERVQTKVKWSNKERVLAFASRGVSYRDRHLMKDFHLLMPHSKTETKMDRKDQLFVINEICEMKNCSRCLYFEAKKKKDLYMWMSRCPAGPSVKFLLENVHTMTELKMTGNCLKGSRPILSFSKEFDRVPYLELLKELFIQIFSTPNYHPKSKPFIDHIFNFTLADNRIWFRNYQIMEENGELAEIGPRLILNPIKIFQGSFGGPTLYQNPEYIAPNYRRKMLKTNQASKYVDHINAKKSRESRQMEVTYKRDATDDVFVTHDV